MADLIIAERSEIVSIANAVRNKTGTTDEMTLGEIIAGINGISTGTDTSVETCTVTINTSAANGGQVSNAYATVLEDGQLTSRRFYPTSTDIGNSLVIENTVRNTQVLVVYSSMAGTYSVEGGELVSGSSMPVKLILVNPTEENVFINIAV